MQDYSTIRNLLIMAKHIMIDFETLSTNPNAAVISLGAVAFTKDGLTGEEFYVNVDGEDCKRLGLHVSESTLQWWAQQSQEAKAALETDKKTLLEALTAFSHWVKAVGGTHVYGNGADFDNPILKSCYEAIQADIPFKPFNGRCYRTLKSIDKVPSMSKRQGTHHNALDDAKSQAIHLLEIRAYMLENPVDILI